MRTETWIERPHTADVVKRRNRTLRYRRNCFWQGQISGGRRRCAHEECTAGPVGAPEARSAIRGVCTFLGREAGEGVGVETPEAGPRFRRAKACCRTKGEFGNTHVLGDECHWRGGQGGAEPPTIATLATRDIKRCPLGGSKMCKRLNERIRGDRDSLLGRIPADPIIRAELDEIVQTVVIEVNPELVILFESRARGD